MASCARSVDEPVPLRAKVIASFLFELRAEHVHGADLGFPHALDVHVDSQPYVAVPENRRLQVLAIGQTKIWLLTYVYPLGRRAFAVFRQLRLPFLLLDLLLESLPYLVDVGLAE